MAGVEVAGLAFGVLPILFEAVRAYSKVYDSLHTFRHWKQEVATISFELKIQREVFFNECRLLLQEAVDADTAKGMLKERNDEQWKSAELSLKLREVLEDNLELCCSIILATNHALVSIAEEMNVFNVLREQKRDNEKLRSAIRRLRGAVVITFDKSKHEESLNKLRARNGELKALREQIAAFQRSTRPLNAIGNRMAIPPHVRSIRSASNKLHDALCSSWRCQEPAHRGHHAKLCLDAEVQGEVCLNIAIACHELPLCTNDSPAQDPPIWLYVQSMTTTSNDSLATTSSSLSKLTASVPPATLVTQSPTTLKKKASSDLVDSSSSGKRAKREPPGDVSSIVTNMAAFPKVEPASPAILELNLCLEENVCEYLKRTSQLCDASLPGRCFGYLETPDSYKHMFFARRKTPKKPEYNTVYSIFEVMRQDVDDAIAVEDQLKLAHKTALAFLQYNNTHWLLERWRLRELSYFGNHTKFNETSLETLHLSSRITAPSQPITKPMEGIEATTGPGEDIRYGINNFPLFFLGVALLEIAQWKPIEESMTDRDDNNEVYAARRLASGRALLGPLYQNIARKCLQCNFGVGTDLSKETLQAAVYNDVVCELEGMIKQLSI